MKVSTAVRNAACDATVDLVDGGSGAGTIGIRTGPAPTNPSDANSGTLLATLTFSDPAFGNSSTGTATASAITDDSSADATGTPEHFRVYDSDNNCIWQGTAGASGGGAELQFTGLSGGQIISGGTVSISSFTVTMPAGT